MFSRRPVSRVLYMTIIYLGQTFLHGSSRLLRPADNGYACFLDVAPDGVYKAAKSPKRR